MYLEKDNKGNLIVCWPEYAPGGDAELLGNLSVAQAKNCLKQIRKEAGKQFVLVCRAEREIREKEVKENESV